MQQPQSVCAVQRLGSNAKTLEVVEYIGLNTCLLYTSDAADE